MACLLGRSWGYDSAGVWVMDGCGGEFLVSQDARRNRGGRDNGGGARRRHGDGSPGRAIGRTVDLDRLGDRCPHRDLGSVRPRQGISRRKEQRWRAFHQRLRAAAVHEPDARRADVHRPPRQRARRRRPARHLLAPDPRLAERLDGRSEAPLHHRLLDRQHHQPECHLRQHRLPVQQGLQPLRRHLRQSRLAVDARLAPLLARQRPRDGGRVLPAVLRPGHLGERSGHYPVSGTALRSETPRAPWASPPARSTGSSPTAARSGGCRRPRSSVRGAATATGRCTKRWRPASASLPSTAPRSATRRSAPTRETPP